MRISCLLFPALFVAAGFAQNGVRINVWIPRGPEGGPIARPVIDPQNPATLYVAAGDLFRTTDSAAHWNQVGASPGTLLAIDPRNSNTLYSSGPSKSTDGGLTWSSIGAGLPTPCAASALVIDPTTTTTVYIACGSSGIFKSTDGGATWSATNSGLTSGTPLVTGPIGALLIDSQNPRTLYAAAAFNEGLFKTTDGAATWNLVWSSANPGQPGNKPLSAVAMDPQNTKTLFVISLGVIAKSTDGGGSWAVVGSVPGSLDLHGLVVDPRDSATLYALGGGNIEKSTDGGASWGAVLSSAPEYDSLSWVAVAPTAGGPSTVYAGGDWRGIQKSTDGGTTWVRSNSGLIATSIDSLAIDPLNRGNLYVGINSAGLFKSTNGAASWSATPSTGVAYAIAVDPWNEGTVYAWDGDGIQKSVDGGQSFTQIMQEGDAGSLVFDTKSPGTLYYHYETGDGYKSTDGGAHWSTLSFPGFLSALATDPQNAATVYAGSVAGVAGGQGSLMSSGVLKSADGGQTWTGVNTLWQMVSVSQIVVDPRHSNIVYATTALLDCSEYSCGTYDGNAPEVVNAIGFYKSTDGGTTWVKLNVPGDAYTRLLGIDRQGALYVWVWSQKQFAKSENGGATWITLSTTGLGANQIMNLAIDPLDSNHLFAGTYGGGLFEITLVPPGTANNPVRRQ